MHDDIVLTGPDFPQQHDIDSQTQESNRTSNCPPADSDSEISETDSYGGANNSVSTCETFSERSIYN